jgi:hypothetical protein
VETQIPELVIVGGPAIDHRGRAKSVRDLRRHWPLLTVAVVVVAAAVAFIEATKTIPSYDAFGWMVWGHQTLHWNLNTDGAPSWKPLTFLFTLLYALVGRNPQMWLWVLTATIGAIAGCALGGRIAYRLVSPDGSHRLAALVGGLFAAAGIFGLGDYTHLILITSSDPFVMMLWLAAINLHMSKRPVPAYVCLLLASFGRPEVWPFALLYAIWMWRYVPSMRWLAVAGLVLIPASWFIVPGITSKSWFISGDLALGSKRVIHGSKIIGVFTRIRDLQGWPLELGALAALALAAYKRDWRPLALAGLAILWYVIEVGFAFHGWSAVPRYLIEPGALMVVLSGAAVGQGLAMAPRKIIDVRWLGPILAVALIAGMIPYAHTHDQTVNAQVGLQKGYSRQLNRLRSVVARLGGPRLVRTCGQPVTFVGQQSEVAWVLEMNVGNVGFHPGRSIDTGKPIVLLRPKDLGWQVRTFNLAPATAARCTLLKTDTPVG